MLEVIRNLINLLSYVLYITTLIAILEVHVSNFEYYKGEIFTITYFSNTLIIGYLVSGGLKIYHIVCIITLTE